MQVGNITITDPIFEKKEQLSTLDNFFMRFIKDERDLPFIYLCIRLLLMVVPVAVVLYIPGWFRWWIAIPYLLLNTAINLGPFILMLHNTSHRKLFKKEYDWMNNFIPWVIGPFFGESPETYYGHHVGMHHPENNLPEDLSCTMGYQRDSVFAFLHYFFSFFLFGFPDLTNYHWRKKRFDFMRWVVTGELSFYLLCIGLSFINWQATLIVFIIPFVIARFGMMAGNWGQHAFIDANDPANCYVNSITCINAAYNKTCFNDGYHIGHHLRPAMHWTDMPKDFVKHADKYAENKAIVFENTDFFVIWFMLMAKNYQYLAKHFVHLDDSLKTDEEVIAFLKVRTRKIPKEQMDKFLDPALLVATRKRA